ncbi:alcohol dehydrogenase 1-like, partial [Dioscorea cayenensis subsp. rotundata]|uniref:alcohol dehydrogenase n=1 Tax=Dioscorea cayennensis subsp. rotundata TaxID=55577 RepID=A0AB40CVA8_DIOCR
LAAVAWKAGQPLVIEEVEVAPPPAMEIYIKILFTSPIDVFAELVSRGQKPVFSWIFGHEAGRIVESIREGFTELAPGDHILPVFIRECKDCAHCKSEESNMSTLLRINTDIGVMIGDGLSRFLINGKPIYHFVRTSMFSKHTVVHVGCLAKPPKGPIHIVDALSIGIPTPIAAVLSLAKTATPESSVVAFGLGAINLAAVEGARITGASRTIGVDVNPRRFLEAKKSDVNEFVNPKDYQKSVQEVLAEMTDGGVDRSIECTGNIDAMILAFECVHDGWGVVVLVRVPHKDAISKTHPMNVLNEITLKGTFFGNCKLHSDLPVVVERYMNKELELEKFITHEVPFFRFPASLLPNKISMASGLRPVLVVHTK